uniref:Uncharacterized protein n=1 Tax=Arundo donax TaxID=35708 RepID=A0A0A8YH17_ARUDO
MIPRKARISLKEIINGSLHDYQLVYLFSTRHVLSK